MFFENHYENKKIRKEKTNYFPQSSRKIILINKKFQ